MSRNIDDISSIFRVSGHPDTIFANESRFLEKSEKSAQYRRYIGKLPIYLTQKMQACEKIKKKTNKLADISEYIANISSIYRRYIGQFVCFFFFFTSLHFLCRISNVNII